MPQQRRTWTCLQACLGLRAPSTCPHCASRCAFVPDMWLLCVRLTLVAQSLSVGAKILGVVSEIGPHELTVTLPHGLRGYVAVKEVCAGSAAAACVLHALKRLAQVADELAGSRGSRLPLARLFHVGQYVRCSILMLEEGAPLWRVRAGLKQPTDTIRPAGNKEQRRRIHLSLRLSRLAAGLAASALRQGACLPGCVTSVEDHGYLLSFGIQVRRTEVEAEGEREAAETAQAHAHAGAHARALPPEVIEGVGTEQHNSGERQPRRRRER